MYTVTDTKSDGYRVYYCFTCEIFKGPPTSVYLNLPIHTVFPRSDAAATINFPLLGLAATIRGRRLLEGGVNYTLHDSLLFSSINFDYVMFKSTIFGSDYC